MTINDKIIETRFVPAKNLKIEGYLEGLKKDMMEQSADIIDLTKEEPEFRFENFIPKTIVN